MVTLEQTTKKNKLIVGNWKMKKTFNDSIKSAKSFATKFKTFKPRDKEVVICPNLVSLVGVKKALKGTSLILGAQNVFWENSGSYTGEVGPLSLSETGCEYVIIGHSERRRYMLENYSMINLKVKAVLNVNGLIPIICVGEEAEDRKTDRRDFVLMNQVQQALSGVSVMGGQQVVIAYEPVWAIGSGTAIEPSEATYAHKIIKLALNDLFGMKVVVNNFKTVYGGSINSKNVKDFSGLEDVDGLLVGGASLSAEEFYKICKNI